MNTPASPIVDEPLPRPRRWGAAELARLTAMVEQESLFYWKGPQSTALLDAFRGHYPLRHAFPCSSGTAALHVAVAALRLEPGAEVIVPPITDMGSVIGLLYQQAVPVFVDVHPRTYNLDAGAVARAITPRTRAIMAVHLAGNPCDMAALKAVARAHQLSVIEDCAQAWGARYRGEPVGLQGDLACYSFNDFKHVSCGDGGIVATSDERFGAGLSKWGDKCYDRVTGGRDPVDLAPNYRMSEPQAAVATAQLSKLAFIAETRNRLGVRLTRQLADTPGLLVPECSAEDFHSFWFYFLRLLPERLKASREEVVAALRSEGVMANAGYIPQPVYRYSVFQSHNFFGGRWPIRELGLTAMDYRDVRCPVAEAVLADGITLPINEAMSDGYIDKVGRAIDTVVRRSLR
ncbi:MAG TPA: DegT/DnrJ/EryC1/StrS family aminotransferase [Opitutaceae bacterium]|nr:DegT/DnrJ/EryC1/StrS family aminotransferase [Opitutaceae bacterium]